MSKLATIYIARHGETEFNRDRKLQGQCDSPLTEQGMQQAELIRKELENIDFDGVFSSEYENLSYKEHFKIKIAPDVESEEEAVSRYITFLREIAVSHLGKKVLVVSHGGIMKSLLFHIDYDTYHTIPPGGVQNCGHIILESDGTDFFVKKAKGVILSR